MTAVERKRLRTLGVAVVGAGRVGTFRAKRQLGTPRRGGWVLRSGSPNGERPWPAGWARTT